MGMLEGMLQEGGPDNEYMGMLQGAKSAAPALFSLLDSDGSATLSKSELQWVTKFHKAAKSGGLRNLTRDCFSALDTDNDDRLSAAELSAAAEPDGAPLASVVELVHAAFPLRPSAEDLKANVRKGLEAIGGVSSDGVASGISSFDTDGDGHIDRKEAGKAYASARTQFLDIAKTVQQMG